MRARHHRGAGLLYIFSGEVPALEAALAEVLGAQRSLVTIPYSPDAVWVAREAAAYFRAVGVKARALPAGTYRDADRLRDAIFTAGAVYLSGGNTFEFLDYARTLGLFAVLERFEAEGGHIVAESAGSIILCDDIATAAIPTCNPDENDIGLTRFDGMGRIAFHISPHFDPAADAVDRDLAELQQLADASQRPVLVLQDGEGVVLRGNEIIRYYGAPWFIEPALCAANAAPRTAHAAVFSAA